MNHKPTAVPSAPPSIGHNGHESPLTHEEWKLWRRFITTHTAIVRRLESELHAQTGLTLSTFEALHELARAPDNELRMAELAEHLSLTRSGVTRLVDRLERQDYVVRRECADDGRGTYARLTANGFEAFLAAADMHLQDVQKLFFDRLDGVEDLLWRLLRQLEP